MSKLKETNEKIAETVVEGYKKIETGVVEGYKKIEKGTVDGFNKVSDKIIEKVFTKENETVDEAKKDLQEINNHMQQEITFNCNYSAKENKEILEIRKKYLPQTESKLEELRRLDKQVQEAGVVEAIVVGILSSLIFGTGLCLAMQVIGSGIMMIVLGVLLGVVGALGMIIAYPIHRRAVSRAKAKNTQRILELSAELTGEKTSTN